MQGDAETEYRYEVGFPIAKAYSVEYVINLISKAAYSQINNDRTELDAAMSARWQSSTRWNDGAQHEGSQNLYKDAQLAQRANRRKLDEQVFLSDQRVYLLHELVNAFVSQKLEFWDWPNGRIINPSEASRFKPLLEQPPSQIRWTYSMATSPETIEVPSIPSEYTFLDLWVSKFAVTKSDLLKFCNSLNVRIIFEGEEEPLKENKEEKKETKDERLARLLARSRALKNQGERAFNKVLAEEEGIDVSRIKVLLKEAIAAEAARSQIPKGDFLSQLTSEKKLLK